MKLDPAPRPRPRVHELAAELGWTSRQLLAELRHRGEFVKSASSTLEAPIVRAIRRDFAVAIKSDRASPEAPALYGQSAGIISKRDAEESFEDAVRRVKPQGKQLQSVAGQTKWVSPVLLALLEAVAARHGGKPTAADRKEAKHLLRDWATACLHGLDDDEHIMVEWIKLSGGRRPMLAAELCKAGISPDEAGLRLGYNGRIDHRWPSVFDRYRDRKVNRSEEIVAVRRCCATSVAG